MTPESSDELEALKPQPSKRKKKRLRNQKTKTEIRLIIEEVEQYCKDCMEWSEVKPILYMLEKLLPRDGPQEIRDAIKRIKDVYMERLYGKRINAKNLVIKRPYIKGPLNSFKNNKRIDLSK
ncbi:MAG: hypothetical protein IKH35_06880 [Prevotella sp.]|jgi:hypothetical protein|nr:hypothetical protein [Prevotella sp.]MBR3110894.1 hypothetical protein [Prevotella sp.]